MTMQDDPEFQAALGLLDAEIAADMARNWAPGLSIAVVQGDGPIWARGFGHADIAAGTPATAETIYAVGSITKLFTATMLARLFMVRWYAARRPAALPVI